MKNCKKFLAMFSVMFVMFFGIVLSGCENDNNMTLSLSKTNIEITLGETESNTATLEAVVENAKTKDISISYDSSDISVSSKSESDGVSLITVKALRQCKNVEVLVKGVKDSKTFYVSVYEPISSISSKQDYFSVEYDFEKGGSFSLSSDLVNILPNGTNQTGLKYSLSTEISGVSIENNVLKIKEGLTNVPEKIDVKVTSVYKSDVSTEITFKVIKAIDISQITIQEDNNILAKSSYNIPRNNTNKNTLLLKVVVPFTVTQEELDVKEIYAYGDIGLKVNESSIQKTDNSYIYSFLFGFGAQTTSLTMVDKIWFNLSYKDYPTISQSTQNMTGDDANGVITITAYDEVTGIGCYVNDTKLSSQKVNLYTSYNNTFGLKVRFDTLPTNALNSKLVLQIAQSDADYVLVKNETGNTLLGKYENSEKIFEFDSGTTFYFVANKSKFEKDKEITITVKTQDSTQSNVIKQDITFVLKEGIDNYGFGTSVDALTKTLNLYLENKVGDNDLTQNTITFGVSPATTYVDNLGLDIYGDAFEVVNRPVKDETISDNLTSFYRLTIKAKQGTTGNGTLTLKFETGQELVANITVIERFETANVNVDLATFSSSSVGKIEQDGDDITFVAVKNNKIIPLKYSANVKISKVEYAFQDCLYSDYTAKDVYDENSGYSKFNSALDVNAMLDTSVIIDADTLKTNKYINTLALGKVWVRFLFFGERLNQDYELEEFFIDKYVLFEVYNPVEYLDVSEKVINIYAYSEVGEVNKSKTMATFTVEINENATYNKILFGIVDNRPDMAVELIDNEITIYSESDGQLLFSVSKVENSNNKYTVKANTRTSENIKYLYVFAKDILDNEASFEKTITFVTNKANLVDKITVTNVNEENGEQTIYLNSTFLSTEYSENNFKILTNVTPVDTSYDALCSDVAYIFYPKGGTSSNIVSISNDGVVSVTGEFGGKGVIRIIPRDAILKDTDGTTYYRENMPYVDINIVVLDGQTKETAKRVYSESDFTNESLYYMLMNDISITSTIFNEFSGGLYGQNIGSSTIWTISTTATLFGKVLSGAIVEDVSICCSITNGSGAITSENYGTIQNVTVDIFANGDNSTVQSDASFVGGLVGENYGTIQNCTFSGSVFGNTSSSTVGAISGKNSGIIESCKALFYSIANQDMKVLGKISAGLVGEMADNGKLSLSYAYNFASSDVGVLSGIVGKISAQSVRVEKCFSELNNVEKLYLELDSQVTNVSAVIKDCYTLSSYKNTDDEIVYKFNFAMTQRNNKTLLGTYLSTDATKTYENVSFGYGDVWANGENSNKNYGFPYLNDVIKISAVSSEELENIQIQKTSTSLASVNNYAILMLTKTNQSLTSKEYEQISKLNTINYTDLFGIQNSKGLVVKSSDTDVISCQNNYLKIVNYGECIITVSSKYDSSIAPKEFNIKVLSLINNFRLLYNNTEIADGVTVGLKKNSTQIITSVIKNQVALGEKVVSLALNDLKVKFISQDGTSSGDVVGEKIGSHYVNLTTDYSKVLSVYLYLDTLSINYQKVLENNTKRTITLKPYKGASAVISSIENASISATDTLGLQITIASDVLEETLACDIFDENGVKVFDSNGESFDGKTNKNLVSDIINITILSTNNNIYKLQVELNKTKLKQIKSTYYTLRFYAQNNNSDVYTDVKLEVLDQGIERVDVYTYSFKNRQSGGEVYSYYPTNTITNNEPSLIDLMIYPSYANFAYLTVTSNVVDGEKLSLLSLRKGSEDNESSSAYYTNYLTNTESLKDENGIKIINKGDQESEVARFYIRALATSSIIKDTAFNLTIKVYNSNDEVILTQIHSVLVSPPQKAGLSIEGKELYNNKYYALVGESLTVNMTLERDQWIDDYGVINDVEDSDTSVGVLTYNNDFTNIDSKYKKCTFTLDLNGECYDDFTIQVNTKRKINGKEETITSTQKVYIVPFEFDMSKTEVSGSAYSDVAIGDIYFKRTLNFNFGANYTESGKVDYTKFISNHYFYSDHSFEVNVNKVLYKNNAQALRNNLFFVNIVDGKEVLTSIYNQTKDDYIQNDITNIVEFSEENGEIHFIGNNVGEQKMRLRFEVVLPDGTTTYYNFDFTIKIQSELNDDEPQQIYTAQEFLDIFNQSEADNYILMNDINLYDFTPITATSSVASLDGNGYTISIVSFASDLSNYALFETIDSTTLIKNLKINTYNVGLINVDSTKVNQVYYAPMSITNNGTITNSEVVNFFNKSNIGIKQQTSGILLSSDIAKNVEAKTAGFVITNNGTITNSRVGDDDGETYTIYKTDRASGDVYTKQYTKSSGTLSEFTINSFGDIAGFVYQNNGHITSSYASNLRIVNNSDVDYTTKTAGFVVENSGEIEMSYSKGVKVQQTDIHATLYGIETAGNSSGFVYQNKGAISDCYSNINLTNKQNNPGRTSAGFVYENAETGTIENSLSLSRIINSTTTQMNFSGVDELGNYLTSGTITNCYYYDQVAVENNTTQIQTAYGESASSISSAIIQDYFYGFNFANANESDGIWKMTSVGPELISANSVAVSLRYVSEKSETLSTPKTTYANGYEYGSKNNPILIKNAKQFNEAFAGNTGKSVDRFVNLANKTITGSYRLISDIDLHDLATETGIYTLNSSTKTLFGNGGDSLSSAVGKFDGNGFSIENLALTNSSDSEVTSFGMFAKLENGAMIINLNIVLGDQNTEKEIFGIEAKNVNYVGTVAGLVEDSKIIGVNVSALKNTNNVTVRGRNAVGGIVGVLRGQSNIVNSKTQDINVTAVYYPESLPVGQTNYTNYNKYDRLSENAGISYAGGIVGIVDYYTNETKEKVIFEDKFAISSSALVGVKNVGCSIIEGGTVGGIAGYSGILTTMQDVQYMPYSTSASDYAKQGLYSYNGFAGGIVGVNKGYLRQVRSEYDNINTFEASEGNASGLTLSELIELNSLSYYNTESGNDKANYDLYNYELGNKEIFQKSGYSQLAIGGLVGLQLSGKIEKSYSKLNVTSNTAKIAGGIIGVIDKITNDSPRTTVGEVYATGDVFAKEVVSGIAGVECNEKTGTDATKASKFEKVNALNLWSTILFDKTYYPKKYTITSVLENTPSSSFEVVTNKVIGFTKQADQWDRLSEDTKTLAEEKYALGYNYGVYNDKIFTANGWDTNFWQRNDDELYPHMVFGYFDRTIKIEVQADIEKLRTNSGSTNGKITYILAPRDDGNNIYENNKHLIKVNKYIVPIVGFSSILSSEGDPTIEYGFYFEKSSRPLFESTISGAIFKDFSVYFAKDATQVTVMSRTSAFVKSASNTYFTNVTFNDINIDSTTTGSLRAGIVCAVATGECFFTKVKINNCTITVEKSSEAYVGAVFGEGDLSKSSQIDVELKRITINGTSIKGGERSSYLGLAMGYVSNFGTININFADDSGESGIKLNEVENAELGLIIGHIEAIDMENSHLSFISKNSFSAKVDVNSIKNNSKIGGLFGYAKKVNISDISFTPNISICASSSEETSTTANDKTFTDSIFGGIVGFAQDCTLQNITLGSFEQKSDTIVNSGTMNIGNVANGNYLGSFVGVIQGNSTISNVVSYASLDVSLKESGNTDDEDDTLCIGGIAGKMNGIIIDEITTDEKAEKNSIRAYGDIYVRFGKVQSDYDMAVGGIAGTIINTTLQNCYTTGSIMLVVPKSNTTDKAVDITYNNVNVYVSGIVGYVEDMASSDSASSDNTSSASSDGNTASTQSVIKNSISAGNVYPTYQKDGTKSLEYTNLLVSDSKEKYIYTTFYYGGIVGFAKGDNLAQLIIKDNVSVNTLYNKLDNGLTRTTGNYHANAIIGSGECKEQANNNYANVYTLTTDSIGTNHKFGDTEILGVLKTFRETDSEYFILGTKINPNTSISALGEIKNQYIYLDPNVEYTNQAIDKLTNSVVISDGAEFVFDENFESKTQKVAPFDTIDQNSMVAGVVTFVSIVNRQNSAAGFANKNAGIIYSCNAVGGRNIIGGIEQGTKETPIRGLVQSTSFAAGFVDTNAGFIKNCFTYLDVKSSYTGKKTTNSTSSSENGEDITVAGFVRVNTGYITTSYVTGEISNINEDESKYCTGKMYLFAPGYVYNCYSIARMVDKDITGSNDSTTTHYSFENGKANKDNCYYDEYAAEAYMDSTTFARNIDDNKDEILTLNYIESAQTEEKTEAEENVEESETTKDTKKQEIVLDGDFGQIVTNSFGYKSFVGGAYEVLDYMHFYTGSGKNGDPFKVPNLGKLRQMAEITENTETIYFQLDNDMNGSYISKSIKWQPDTEYYDISNIVLNGAKVDYKGSEANENYEISNLTSLNQGLFNTIKDSTIKNIDLKDISTAKVDIITIDKIEQNQLYFGLLACYTENSTIFNNTLNINISILNEMIAECEQTITFGLLVGKVKGGTISSCTADILYSDANSSLLVSNRYNWTIGGLIGELEDGKVQSAVLTGTKESTQNGDIEVPAFSIQFNGNKKVSDSFLSPQYDDDGNIISGEFIIGGIVGKQMGGQIINTGIYCDINAFTNEQQIGIDQILKVGGIVGESTTTSTQKESGIVMCYTDSKVKITGGNAYSFKKTYVAGICGYGGTIYQCKNEASVMAMATYYYTNFRNYEIVDETQAESSADTVNKQWLEQNGYSSGEDENGNTFYYKESGDYIYFTQEQDYDTYKIFKGNYVVKTGGVESVVNGFTREDVWEKNGITKSTYSKYYNCYQKGDYFDQYNKLLFARLKQEAYAGGIANNYKKVEYCLNTSSNISGGMDSKNLHSEYAYDGWGVAGLITTTTVAIIAGDTIYDACMAMSSIGAATGLATAVAPALIAMNWKIGLKEHYFGGNGYTKESENSYYIGGQYNNDDWFTSSNWIEMSVNVVSKSVAGGILAKAAYKKAQNKIFEYVARAATKKIAKITSAVLWVAPFAMDIATGVIPQFVTTDPWILPVGQISPYDDGLVTKDDFKNIAQNYSSVISSFTSDSKDYYTSDSLEIYDIYFDAIGLPASEGSKTNSYSTTQVFDAIKNGNKTYYKVNDNSKVSEDKENGNESASDYYGIVYNSSAMGKLTTIQNPSSLLENGFELVGSDYKLSAQTQKTDMEKLLKNVNIDKKTNTITININYSETEGEKPNEIYNKAVEMINTISPKMTEKEYNTYKESQKCGDLESTLDAIKEIVITVGSNYSFVININTSLNGVTLSLGTSDNPFVGTISGTGTGRTISGIETPSLISYGNNVMVSKLNLSYYEVNDKGDSTSFGGVISNAQGDINVDQVNVSYSISTYEVDIRDNVVAKGSGVNIGGFIGTNNGNAKISNSTIQSLNIDIRTTDASETENLYGVGGFVGLNNGKLEISNTNVYSENIYAKDSQTDVFGGAVGLNKGKLNIQKVIVGNDQSSIDVESITNQTIVGGLVGKTESGSSCTFENVQISLKGIYAKTSNKTSKIYAGGLIGFDETGLDTSKLDQINIGNSNSKIKMLVYAGIDGSEFASESHANDVIGNKKVELNDTCTVSTTSKAFAKPTYKKYPADYDSSKSTVKIDASNVVGQQTKLYSGENNYLKIDLFEFATESYSSSENVKSFVNEEGYIPYNYHKAYLLSVIKKTTYSTKDTSTGTEDRFEFVETFYKIDFVGAPSQNNELDIGCTYTIEFIAYNKYFTDKDIYGSYKNSAYPLSKRYNTYIPSDLQTIYKQKDISLSEIDENTEVFEENGKVETIDSIVKTSYFDFVSNKIKVNYINSISNTQQTSYKNIYINDNFVLYFEMQDTYGQTLEASVFENSKNLAKFYSSEPEDGNGTTRVDSYGYNLTKEYNDIVTSETINRFAFRYNIADSEESCGYAKRYYDIVEPEYIQEKTSIKIYEKLINIDSNAANYRKIYIISDQTTDGEKVECVEYIYIVSSDGKTYNMGNIQYKYIQKNENLKRTGLFFPYIANEDNSSINDFITDCDYYQNNLLSLTDVEETNKFEITKNVVVKQNIWYFDVQTIAISPDFELTSENKSTRLHKMEISTGRTDTYTFTLSASEISCKVNTKENKPSTYDSWQESVREQKIFVSYDKEGKEVAKYTLDSAIWKNASEGKYNFKGVEIRYTDNIAKTSVLTSITWNYLAEKESDFVTIIVSVGSNMIYTAEYTKVGDISYLIGKEKTYLKFGNDKQYTINGEYIVTQSGENYKLENQLTSGKISYIIMDKNGNVLEVVYKQQNLYVKEDYANNEIVVSKNVSFEDSQTISYTFDSINIKVKDSTQIFAQTYITENIDTKVTYYSLNKISDQSEIQLFSQDLEIMQRAVKQLNGSSVYVYIIDGKMSIYSGTKEIVKDTETELATIDKIELGEENGVTYVDLGTTKIDISNGLVFLGSEIAKTKSDVNTNYAISYDVYNYEGKTIFAIKEQGQDFVCGKVEVAQKNATIDELLPINSGEYVIKCSDTKFYSIDGQYSYVGNVTKNADQSKTYTALGGLSATFVVYNVKLDQYKNDKCVGAIDQTVVIQTSATTNGLSGGTKSTNFNITLEVNEITDLNKYQSIKNDGYKVVRYSKLKDNNSSIDNNDEWDIETDDKGNPTSNYSNGDKTKTGDALESEGYIPITFAKYENGEITSSISIHYDTTNKKFDGYMISTSEQTVTVTKLERIVNGDVVRDLLYDKYGNKLSSYEFTIGYTFDEKPDYYNAVRVTTGTNGSLIENVYGTKDVEYGSYPIIDGLNLFGLKVIPISD